MSDIQLFSTKDEVQELVPSQVTLEKELQNLIEKNMKLFFGVQFLESEYRIKDGRMDSIGIDENNSPVIFEYKRSINENVINQGLFYLDWLLDHKGDFKLLVLERLGEEAAEAIDWSIPTLFCVANDFTKYDVHAVNQMQRNIRLVKYKKYNNGQILFEHLNTPTVKAVEQSDIKSNEEKDKKTHLDKLAEAPEELRTIYFEICNYIESLGDDVSANQLKFYKAYKKVQNIVCIEILKKHILLYLKLDPATVELKEGFINDMTNKGHYGTGDLQIVIKTPEDFIQVKSLLDRAYNE